MSRQFPQGRTAFLLIHGIGDQQAFDTLDAFTRGVQQHLDPQLEELQLEHKICFRQSSDDSSAWMQSYIRITPTQDNDDRCIDVHEFYWAYLTEGKISTEQVTQWLGQTIRGAKDFSKNNQEFLDKYHAPMKENQTKHRTYWWRLQSIAWRLYLIYPFIRLLEWFIFRLPPAAIVLDRIRQIGLKIVVDFIGDVAIYTSTEQKSLHYEVRQRILHESQIFLEGLLDESIHNYDRIIIVGHSLGSVIAYDTLNRLNIKANNNNHPNIYTYIKSLEKIHGLVTIGSPLDKVLFYFRPQTKDTQTVREQLLTNIHSFKRRKNTDELKQIKKQSQGLDQNPIKQFFDKIWWVNLYHEKDPISGFLNFYDIKDENNIDLASLTENNSALTSQDSAWGSAHNSYWKRSHFYKKLFEMLSLNSSQTSTQ